MTRSTRVVLAAAAAGFVLRACFALFYWVGQPMTHDEREYLALARSLARGDGFTYPADEPDAGTGQRFGRAPGYPVFLAALGVTQPADHVPVRVQVAQCVLGAVGIIFIAALAGRAAGPAAAAAAAVTAAVYPPLVWMPAYALSETVYATLALAAAWLLGGLSREWDRATMVRLVAAAALTAAAILVRPAMAFFVPFALVWLWRRFSGAARIAAPAALAVVIACALLPWTIRNHRTYGRWVVVASEGGVTFWTGNHPLAIGDGDLAANPAIKRADLVFRRQHPGLTPEQLEPLYYEDALGWIRAHPGAWLRLEARKAFFTVVPIGPSYTLHSLKYFLASALAYLIVLPAALVGAWRLRHSPRAPVPLWLMAAATVAAGLVFFPQERFRIPVIDPALIVSAAALAGWNVDERTGRRPHV